MMLLLDIGNTHLHVGVANGRRVTRQINLPTHGFKRPELAERLRRFARGPITGAALCSVVPRVTPVILRLVRATFGVVAEELNHRTVRGVGVDYPRPQSIGPDRLANAIAARHHFGAPSLVVDFGTAVTFDVVNAAGDYAGGIIAPGLAAMTDYLHERTALLPRIRIRDTESVIGKSTKEAMLIGAVHGYRGLVRELIGVVKRELGVRRLLVVATGGYAELMARDLPAINAVAPDLTLEGLRLFASMGRNTSRP